MFTMLLLLSLQAAAPATAPKLIRGEAGPSGVARAGTFVLDEQRDAFDVAKDQRVYVVFEWEGKPGPHHCELVWTAPDGSIALQSALDLDARGPRFSGYWALLLNPTIARGLWAAEVTVDGQKAGSKTFRITGPIVARELPPDELYKRAMSATVKLVGKIRFGEPRSFSGFAIGPNAVITTFGALNAADSIEVLFGDGTRAETTEVWSFSRELDWALLKVAVPESARSLKTAETTKVGDRCLFLDAIEGQRQMAPCSILGEDRSAAVLRYTIGIRPADAAVGSPLLNAFGDIVGMVGAASKSAVGTFADERMGMHGGHGPNYALVVLPTKGLKGPEGTTEEALAAFWERGVFFRPVTASGGVEYGFLVPGLPKQKSFSGPTTNSNEFSLKDGAFTAVVFWQSREKRDTTIGYACYDLANRRLIHGQPLKVSLKPGQRTESSTGVDFTSFAPGQYRLDILLGDEVAWRTFFTVR